MTVTGHPMIFCCCCSLAELVRDDGWGNAGYQGLDSRSRILVSSCGFGSSSAISALSVVDNGHFNPCYCLGKSR